MARPFMKRKVAARQKMKAVLQKAMEEHLTVEVDMIRGQPRFGKVTKVDDVEFMLTIGDNYEYHGLIQHIVGVLLHMKKSTS